MRRTTPLLLLVATVATTLCTTAALAQTAPQGNLDASCQVSANQASRFNRDQQAAQTFTAANSGKLTSAQVQVDKDAAEGSGDYVLKIATVDSSGVPTASVLASATIPNSSVPLGQQTLTANFPLDSAPQVVAGQQYALIVQRGNNDTLLTLYERGDNPCPGGSHYWSTAGGPFIQIDGNRDLIYATYVTPPPPLNDDFANVQTISGSNASVSGTTAAATRETGEPQHDVLDPDSGIWPGDHSVWYSWKAPASGSTTIDTCQANIDSILAVYTGSQLSSLTRVADNNNHPDCPSGSWGSKVTFNAKAGTTYRIAVADAGGLRENTFTLNLLAPADTTAPKVRRVVPQENATGIAPGANVNAFFSEKMKVGSINSNTVKLYQKGTTTALPAVVSYDKVAKKATLDPDANLKAGKTYKAVVTTGVKDLAGNRMATSKVWFFTVRT